MGFLDLKYENWDEPPLSYGYGVSCNQSDTIEWLIAHDIAFKALCHYGHESVIFDGEKIYTIPNFGIEAEMHGTDELDYYFNKGTIRQFVDSCIRLLSGRKIREKPTKSIIIKVRSKYDYGETTKSILNLPCEGPHSERD